jgi:thiamine-monophosphate kinase
MREGEIIDKIARAVPSLRGAVKRSSLISSSLRLGIGDDAAIVAPGRSVNWVLSCDAFLEGVHFLAERHPADSVGFKALARATSDLAAMGARPRIFLLTLALPAARTGKWLDEFLRGMKRAARQLGMRLAGGDTTQSPIISISITVLGDVAPGHAVKRYGARAGDILYVSGRLGGARLGLEMVTRSDKIARERVLKSQNSLLKEHLYPTIRVALGQWLAERRIASAMIDLSDGLSMDLARLCAASGVGARVWAGRIPCVKMPPGKSGDAVLKLLKTLKLDTLEMALRGGDDYELLFTVPRRHVRRLRGAPGFSGLRAIGEIERGHRRTLVDVDGHASPLHPAGWDPFTVR